MLGRIPDSTNSKLSVESHNEQRRATMTKPDVRGNPRYLELLDYMRDLHVAKAAGYAGEGEDTWSNFREAESWGVTTAEGVAVRLGDKYRRAQNVFRSPYLDQVGESLPATLVDLASYALILLCIYEEKTGIKLVEIK
jgi:hypothetical protein